MDTLKILNVLNFIVNFNPFCHEPEKARYRQYSRCRKAHLAFLLDLFVVLVSVRALSIYLLIRYPSINHQFNYLIKFLNPAFNEMNVLVPVYYLSTPAYILFTYIILPRLIKGNIIALDPRPIKFILEPECAIKSSNDKINQIIHDSIDSVERKRLDILDQINELYAIKLNDYSRIDDMQQGSVWKGLEQCRDLLINLKQTNPKSSIYTYSLHTKLKAKIKSYANLFLVSFAIGIGVLFIATLQVLVDDKCKNFRGTSGKCNLTIASIFFKEQSRMIEFIVIDTLGYFSFVFIIIVLTISFVCQLNLIAQFRSELLVCLGQLRYYNSRLFNANEKEVFKIIQDALIKVRVFDDEMKRGTKLISTLVSLFVVLGLALSSGLVIGFVTAKRSEEWARADLLVLGLFNYGWVTLNIPSILVAYINARALEAIKLYWPIRGELLHHLIRNKTSRGSMSHLMDQWVELERYWFESSADQYIAGCLGINFTYQSVIEFNFYVISIISFLFK